MPEWLLTAGDPGVTDAQVKLVSGPDVTEAEVQRSVDATGGAADLGAVGGPADTRGEPAEQSQDGETQEPTEVPRGGGAALEEGAGAVRVPKQAGAEEPSGAEVPPPGAPELAQEAPAPGDEPGFPIPVIVVIVLVCSILIALVIYFTFRRERCDESVHILTPLPPALAAPGQRAARRAGAVFRLADECCAQDAGAAAD